VKKYARQLHHVLEHNNITQASVAVNVLILELKLIQSLNLGMILNAMQFVTGSRILVTISVIHGTKKHAIVLAQIKKKWHQHANGHSSSVQKEDVSVWIHARLKMLHSMDVLTIISIGVLKPANVNAKKKQFQNTVVRIKDGTTVLANVTALMKDLTAMCSILCMNSIMILVNVIVLHIKVIPVLVRSKIQNTHGIRVFVDATVSMSQQNQLALTIR
jgi:hypothetical protein